MFCDTQNKFYHAEPKEVATVYALNQLINACVANGTPQHLAAAKAIQTAMTQGIVTKHYNPRNPRKKGDQKGAPGYYDEVLCLVVVGPGSSAKGFLPNRDLGIGITPNKQSWGWGSLTLLDHQKVLNKLAVDMDITFDTSKLRDIRKWQKQLDSQDLVVRTPDAEIDYARCQAVAVFCETNQGYATKNRWTFGTLAGALLFENQHEAEKYIRREQGMDASKHTMITVAVGLNVSSVPASKRSKTANMFQEATARLRKEEIEASLKDMTIEQLEHRLSEMGGEIRAATKPKRM